MKRQPDQDEQYLGEDYRRRRVPVRPAKAIGSVMGQLLAKKGYGQVQAAKSCASAWQEALGSRFPQETRCGSVRGGILEVTVSNSLVLQELTFIKTQLVKQLTSLAPEHKITGLRFKVGAVG
jgi:predicted nucleic acid-binding Zn ribbon protein